ncbi:MAG: hydrogenase formation protein HypD, partial [Mariprofundaceae bacterium]|nr:hydrogenase formation protein HypD [Mariprofundaceae bacterium]
MKFIDEYRDSTLIRSLVEQIGKAASRKEGYRLMEFCGGHTHALYRYGLIPLLPETVEMVHGPGCPVCVLPISRIDAAVALAAREDVIFCSYGDMLRVPGSDGKSLLKAKAEGADVRMIYSPLDAVKLALQNPDSQVVFFAVGFETTAPATALALKQAEQQGIGNFFVFCNHVLTPPAMRAILDYGNGESGEGSVIDGIVGPGHVSAIIGSSAYAFVAEENRIPLVISGFEPVDLLESILMLVRQVNEGRAEIENQYIRVVKAKGNPQAVHLMDEVFELRGSFEWRGFGMLANSAQKISSKYAAFDAELKFQVQYAEVSDHKACRCADVLRGLIQPEQCSVFGKVCTPENPLGACMVSSEGACAAAYSYGGV